MLKEEYVLSNREGGFPEVPDKLCACFSLVIMYGLLLCRKGNEIGFCRKWDQSNEDAFQQAPKT